MSTLNLLPFIATQNALAVREERVPLHIYSKANNLAIPDSLNKWLDKIEDYLNGMRLFGQENGRKEDGYGERTYHLKDLEDLINILRSIGLSKSYPDMMSDFKEEDGWSYPQMTTETHQFEDNIDVHERTITLEGLTFDEIYEGIKNGTYNGLDCVDYSGVVHRECRLIKISDLHPASSATRKVLNPKTEKYEPQEYTINGVDSNLYLIVTPECDEKGWSTPEGTDEPTLQASSYLRSPLGFLTMRLSRLGDIKTRFPNGTGLLKSLCPVNIEYSEFDSVVAKATLVIQNTLVPGIIYKSIAHAKDQAFLTPEHLEAYVANLDYALSPEDEEDGIANIYKGWIKLTGQHYQFGSVLEEALMLFNARPKVIDEKGSRAGRDLRYSLVRVVDIKFNARWAIIEEFDAILNPAGSQSGKSSIISANPVPYYIHTLNQETKEWEKDPMTKWILTNTNGRRFFGRDEDPFKILDVNELGPVEFKPLADIYDRVKASHEEAVNSLKKD